MQRKERSEQYGFCLNHAADHGKYEEKTANVGKRFLMLSIPVAIC